MLIKNTWELNHEWKSWLNWSQKKSNDVSFDKTDIDVADNAPCTASFFVVSIVE